jgi:hypothetical protein
MVHGGPRPGQTPWSTVDRADTSSVVGPPWIKLGPGPMVHGGPGDRRSRAGWHPSALPVRGPLRRSVKPTGIPLGTSTLTAAVHGGPGRALVDRERVGTLLPYPFVDRPGDRSSRPPWSTVDRARAKPHGPRQTGITRGDATAIPARWLVHSGPGRALVDRERAGTPCPARSRTAQEIGQAQQNTPRVTAMRGGGPRWTGRFGGGPGESCRDESGPRWTGPGPTLWSTVDREDPR